MSDSYFSVRFHPAFKDAELNVVATDDFVSFETKKGERLAVIEWDDMRKLLESLSRVDPKECEPFEAKIATYVRKYGTMMLPPEFLTDCGSYRKPLREIPLSDRARLIRKLDSLMKKSA